MNIIVGTQPALFGRSTVGFDRALATNLPTTGHSAVLEGHDTAALGADDLIRRAADHEPFD